MYQIGMQDPPYKHPSPRALGGTRGLATHRYRLMARSFDRLAARVGRLPGRGGGKLGLSTAGELEAAEREITHAALILLRESPVQPSHDLSHLRAIYKRIFGDIYQWAGQVRTVAIAKGAMFCLPQYIESSAAVIFGELRGENFLRGLDRDAFIRRLAHYLGEVNALHPFREGNGRAQRAFFQELAHDAGYPLSWQNLDADRNVEASAAIMRGDAEPMRKLLDVLVRDDT
jgi:cell filamentation protein